LHLALYFAFEEPQALGLVVRGVEHVGGGSADVIQHEKHHLHGSLVLRGLTQKVFFVGFPADVVGDGVGLGKLKVPLDDVWQVGKI
jgi:hypothetical protein